MIADVDATNRLPLIHHGNVGALAPVGAAPDNVAICREQHLLTDRHGSPGLDEAAHRQVRSIADTDVAVLAAQHRATPDQHIATDEDSAVVGALGVENGKVVDHGAVAEVNLMQVAKSDSAPDDHPATDRAEKEGRQCLSQKQSQRSGQGCEKGHEELVFQKREQAV